MLSILNDLDHYLLTISFGQRFPGVEWEGLAGGDWRKELGCEANIWRLEELKNPVKPTTTPSIEPVLYYIKSTISASYLQSPSYNFPTSNKSASPCSLTISPLDL